MADSVAEDIQDETRKGEFIELAGIDANELTGTEVLRLADLWEAALNEFIEMDLDVGVVVRRCGTVNQFIQGGQGVAKWTLLQRRDARPIYETVVAVADCILFNARLDERRLRQRLADARFFLGQAVIRHPSPPEHVFERGEIDKYVPSNFSKPLQEVLDIANVYGSAFAATAMLGLHASGVYTRDHIADFVAYACIVESVLWDDESRRALAEVNKGELPRVESISAVSMLQAVQQAVYSRLAVFEYETEAADRQNSQPELMRTVPTYSKLRTTRFRVLGGFPGNLMPHETVGEICTALQSEADRAGGILRISTSLATDPNPAGNRRPTVNDRMKAEMAADLETVKGWAVELPGDEAESGLAGEKDEELTWHEPGLFYFDGRNYELNPRHLDVLVALVDSRLQRQTTSEIAKRIEDDTTIGDTTIKGYIANVRRALRTATSDSGINCDDPIKCIKGAGAYELKVDRSHFTR